MAVIYEFPKGLEEKLEKIDQLIERQYVDQAICQLESYLEQPHLNAMHDPLRKKLLTCYVMKKEFEPATKLVMHLQKSPSYDLSVRAHDILLAKWKEEEDKQPIHAAQLGTSSIYYQTLLELMAELHVYYVTGWQQKNEQKLRHLSESESIEQALHFVADLQEWSTEELTAQRPLLESLFDTAIHPLVKTSLFELLVMRQVNMNVVFHQEPQVKNLSTSVNELHVLKEVIETGEAFIQHDVPQELQEICSHYYRLFCLSQFPFFEELDVELSVFQLLKHFGLESAEKNDIMVSRLEKKPILSQTLFKVDSFILSLTK